MLATSAMSLLFGLIAFFITTVLAAPTTNLDKRCDALIETVPWQLVNVQLFNATTTGTTPSSISFHFCDQSPRLELETECSYTFQPGESGTPGPGYEPCANDTIGFTYNDGLIQVERHYEDPCLGPPPLYDQGTFFGHNNTQFTVTKVSGGELSTQTMLEVPVTSQD